MFCWPCISIRPCNENQFDALFILSLFLHSTSTCFGHICNPSSGGILYIHNTYQLLCIYSIPSDDGLQICPKHVEVDCRNKLRINSASSWFSLHGCFWTVYTIREIVHITEINEIEHVGDRENFVQERREQRHKQTKKNSFQAGTEVSQRYNAIFSDVKSDIQCGSLTLYQKTLPPSYVWYTEDTT